MRRTAWAAPLGALALAGCGVREWTTPIATVDCGTTKLRFEEHGSYLGFPAGSWSFTPALLMNQGDGWKLVDGRGAHEGPSGYDSLLPSTSGFHVFVRPPGRARQDDDVHSPWVIYANPSEIDDAHYSALSACIETNLAAIDAAWEKKRYPERFFEQATDRRLRITSIIHLAHDPLVGAGRSYEDRTTNEVRWDCPGGAFIRATPPDSLELCKRGVACGQIGRISEDQTSARLYPWSYLIPAAKRMTGPEYKAFYGKCVDSAGRSFYDVLKPVDWEVREPPTPPPAAR